MNLIYIGKPTDDNIGNGKTVSAVSDMVDEWLQDETKSIFSNIKIKTIPYTQFTPDNIDEVLETDNALVLLDEIHAIVHKNHKIQERCNKHGEYMGLCYQLSEFFRQVRKRKITTRSTAQVFYDMAAQYRALMQRQILCEKFHSENGRLYKCNSDICPEDHEHYIKQKLYRNLRFVQDLPIRDPSPYYEYYDSHEIIKGWVTYE